jgi:hypothetical protein
MRELLARPSQIRAVAQKDSLVRGHVPPTFDGTLDEGRGKSLVPFRTIRAVYRDAV